MQVICCHWIADLVVLPSPRSLGFRGPMPPCFPFHFHADDETFWDVASEMTRRWPKTKATFNSQIVKIKSNSKAPAPCQASAISHQPSATNHQAASSNHWALSTAYIAYSTYVPYSMYAATTDIDIDPRTFHAPLTENKFAFAILANFSEKLRGRIQVQREYCESISLTNHGQRIPLAKVQNNSQIIWVKLKIMC